MLNGNSKSDDLQQVRKHFVYRKEPNNCKFKEKINDCSTEKSD